MTTFIYRPKGVCSREMRFDIDHDVIRKVDIVGGCPGNLMGIASFEGVRCGAKPTSCPDQIAHALKEYEKQL